MQATTDISFIKKSAWKWLKEEVNIMQVTKMILCNKYKRPELPRNSQSRHLI
jgi:hypothetical protein